MRKDKKTERTVDRGFAFQVVALLLELPPPAEDIIGLTNPVKQSAVFNQTGPTIHALGIGIAVGESAIQAQFGVLAFF